MHSIAPGYSPLQLEDVEVASCIQRVNIADCLATPLLKQRHERGLLEERIEQVIGKQVLEILL